MCWGGQIQKRKPKNTKNKLLFQRFVIGLALEDEMQRENILLVNTSKSNLTGYFLLTYNIYNKNYRNKKEL